jgi:2-amino-4-hydroxy-6-hydroxymethyldihydropteridine diphosphokinase
MAQCLVALGANLGDRRATLSQAVARIAASPGITLVAQSDWYETPAVGGPADQPPFLNGAVRLDVVLGPHQLLAILRDIESDLGRARDVRWGPRTLDLDLLLYGELVLESPNLTLPHPRMAYRRFVLEPAAEVAADMRHPLIGWTIRELRDHLRHATPYVAITRPAGSRASELARALAERFSARLISDPGRRLSLAPTDEDSSGPVYAREIELLDLRRQILEAGHGLRISPILAISDFWLAQSRACAAAMSDPQEARDLEAAVDAACKHAVRPKLLILLAPSERDLRAQRSVINEPNARWSARERGALVELARQPGVGPLLHLTNDDPVANLDEAAAAIVAMT